MRVSLCNADDNMEQRLIGMLFPFWYIYAKTRHAILPYCNLISVHGTMAENASGACALSSIGLERCLTGCAPAQGVQWKRQLSPLPHALCIGKYVLQSMRNLLSYMVRILAPGICMQVGDTPNPTPIPEHWYFLGVAQRPQEAKMVPENATKVWDE